MSLFLDIYEFMNLMYVLFWVLGYAMDPSSEGERYCVFYNFVHFFRLDIGFHYVGYCLC